ncbi:hypothetical protein [uncultured Gammaproteobacteria bacterium]|uniref:hypothetical protein n=1 Tax=Bathymodiolus heckerae thiotrophic gill symbiont TaxID=1052212 RepID=UPI0010B46A28|nr:hypothetical protein [Bathymodiolus heckerae thiotrophic gill symbiont]CAC9588388.1 hypothetical protein [uncultured Gammaproteobacteria bacterium]CAC9593529.1 hypothetical protein [uncultured Gammaproteobacteria bacterium]SHN89556.1 hypothetical protein BHECKSOX_2018 [Bathymodiolus heckerae thiotrophic gill symbiont]
MTELLLLIGGFWLLQSSDTTLEGVEPLVKDKEQQAHFVQANSIQHNKKVNQTSEFEIINKNGIWIFAPVQTKTQKNKVVNNQQDLSGRFITLPDGSKIERGF